MIDQTALSAARRDARKRYGIRVVASVTDEPISLEEAWAHLRLEPDGSPPSTDHDAWLTGVGIPGARDYCEHFLGRSIAQQTLELATNGFPSGFISLPFGPVQSVVSIKYLDQSAYDAAYTAAYDAEFLISADVDLATAAGTAAGAAALEQTMDSADYELDSFALPPRVILAYGSSWPTARDSTNSVKIQYTTGYDLLDQSPPLNPLPSGIRAALLLMLGHLFENREATAQSTATSSLVDELPLGVAALLERYRLRLSMA